LLRGERVRCREYNEIDKGNLYCTVCRHKWRGKVVTKWLSKREFYIHLRKKGFLNERDTIRNNKYVEDPEITKMRKFLKYKKITTILAFTTGIDIRKFNPYKPKEEAEET